MKIKRFVSLFIFLCLICVSNLDCQAKKSKKSKNKEQKEKMVETVQEWEEKAQNIPLNQRKLEPFKAPESDKKTIYPEPHFIFELYNNPPGSRELNIQDITKDLYSYPYIVADNKCHKVAYTRFYYSPDIKQISSEIYVGNLDTSKVRVKRMLDYNHNQENRIPILKSGMNKHYPNLFNSLTIVDWSKDGNKLLIKENIGSTINGIYKTNLYIHIITEDFSDTFKLSNLHSAIKAYARDNQNINLDKFRYYLKPLGFNAENDNEIITLAYLLDKNSNKIFLGKWGYDIYSNSAHLISETEMSADISTNGLILIKSLD